MALGKIWFDRLFRKDPYIRARMPHTVMFNEARLTEFLNRYGAVYLKPDGGARGQGIVRAWKSGPRIHYVREKGLTRTAASVPALVRALGLRQRPYVLQQAIDLACVNGRPFDIRLMMMRDRSERWHYVGMVAKVAGERSIVTNVARGKGYVLSIDDALRRSLGQSGPGAASTKGELIRLAERCTKLYSAERYDWQIGYDLAVDRKGKVWFIESNPTWPAYSLFRKETATLGRMRALFMYHMRKGKRAANKR